MPSSTPSSTAEGADPDAAAGTQDILTGPIGGVGASRFVAFGDSLTQGVESSFDIGIVFDGTPVSYPTQMLGLLRSRHASQMNAFAVVNRGIGGETAATGAQRLQSVLTSDRPQVLLLLEGINDFNNGASIGQTVNHLQTMVETARLNNVTVLIANMFQTYQAELQNGIVHENARTIIPSFNAAIQQMIQGKQNVFLVDLYGSFASHPNPRSLIGNDGLHPTPAGYARMAERFVSTTELAFPVRGSFQ